MAPMKKKSHGSIRSPHVKRNIQSQVVMKGWLFKLEGGALKQFKQRWCVLADFCLFFYKGPSEDKLTSSILLPSYKISPCTSDDKVSKKFAFKAEHQNMKTYYFAAEEMDSMKRWMNAISLASIMQKFVRSENYDATFSSASNDDEDCGFKSHRSRRYTSQKLTTAHDSHFNSESLKQRSNSYSDRMGEVYLSSDDKYPDTYKNSHQYNAPPIQDGPPRRQPLYANAPPKPRRLNSESYAPYPHDYSDARDLENFMPASTMHYPGGMHSDYHQAMGYFPNQNSFHGPEINATRIDPRSVQCIENHPQTMHPETPDLYHNQPPRPRSADFLEREAECQMMPDVAQYTGKVQPQRPKSSLEYYNHYVDSDDGNFDDYREAVRIQADNLYLNKNMSKNQNQYGMKQKNSNDPKLNIHYMSNTGLLTNDSISPCYASTSKNNSYDKYQNVPMSQTGNFESMEKEQKPPNSRESMQRLVEWKKRMLQSPLSKRNYLHSNSSETSSPMSSPMKTYKVETSNKKPVKIPAALETQAHVHHSPSYSYTHQPDSSYNSQNIIQYSDSYEFQQPYNDIDGYNIKTESRHSEHFEQIPSKVASEPSKKLRNENLLYCVDSENNEILFSYNDNSPNDDEISKNLQTCHYPPQMHSFSTLPNVSSIGNESQDSGQSTKEYSSKVKYSDASYKTEPNDSNPTIPKKQVTTYSSDDEDIGGPSRKLNPDERTEIIENNSHNFTENHQVERYQTSSPDYVNIGPFCNESNPSFVHEIVSPNESFEINQAVLKPLEQASKSLRNVSYSPKEDPNVIGKAKTAEKVSKLNLSDGPRLDDDNAHNQTFTSITSKDTYDSDLECDIKREDYYRASQIFYASTRAKLKAKANVISKPKNIVEKSPQRESGYANVSMEDKTSLSFSSLDKDIGIPIQITPNKPPSKKKPDILESNKYSCENSLKLERHKEIDSAGVGESFNNAGLMREKLPDERSETGLLSTDDGQNNNPKRETDKKLSYEEMRGQLLRKREAPPPNIVQERIKKFETVDSSQKSVSSEQKTNSLPISDSRKEKMSCRSIGKRNRHKTSRQKTSRRILHSDSEAMALDDTDESSDDLTMKSAPILLSPLSSVLADLRKTAEAGKEHFKPCSKETTPISSAMKEYFHSLNESDLPNERNSKTSKEINYSKRKHSYETIAIPVYKPPCSELKWKEVHMLNSNKNNMEEVEYLPMDGLKSLSKNVDNNEPEYVSMSGFKYPPSLSNEKFKKSLLEEEHVYNEPFSPPPSFLHDVYEKQKLKQMQYDMKSSSSEDSLTENIYEKPFHRFPSGSVRSLRNEYTHRSVQETNSVLMSSLSCSNVTSVGRNNVSKTDSNLLERNVNSLTVAHHYEQPTLSVSVPDLLQLQEMKDSDASDADDEASRDFDSVGGTRLPSYQSSILDHFSSRELKSAKLDCNSSFDSEILAANLEDLPRLTDSHSSHHYELSDYFYQSKTKVNEVKPMPSHQAICSSLDNTSILSSSEYDKYGNKSDSGDAEKIYQTQKLRVYTKGKKPEAPKIFPVPFNLEESEICKILERKDSTKSPKLLDVNVNKSGDTVSVESYPVDGDSLSENVAYVSRSEVNPSSSINLAQTVPSYRPDVVPEIKVEEKVPNDKDSPAKSPNSAPYYYSDLYFANGIGFLPSHLPFLKKNDMPPNDKASPPKKNAAVLNNVYATSMTSCKGDVGKKVNKIYSRPSAPSSKDSCNNKAQIKYWKGEGARSNLRCSLDILQSSKSKYLDAEKNKYEAGHTLEKTRSSNPMSVFKHRASTPELNASSCPSGEPVYENLVFQPKLKLQKRLSHSLEGLSSAPDLAHDTSQENEFFEEHVYENIEYFNLSSRRTQENPQVSKTLTHEDESSPVIQVSSQDTSSFPQRQFCTPVTKATPPKSEMSVPVLKNQIEANFLGQCTVGGGSEQKIFPKSKKLQTFPAPQNRLATDHDVVQQCSLNVSNDAGYVVKETKECSINHAQESLNVDINGKLYDKHYDSDSSSGATSSYDEASLDSDNPVYNLNSKAKNAEMSKSISSEMYKKEPAHVRKLVQQSEGLMCKGKRLSVSAGDLLGKTHEELVLLLIQLRRNQTKILRAKEKLEKQIRHFQEMPNSYQPTIHNSKDLQRQIQMLEKQYEVTQPLVTLVDNMVKLGSLYGNSNRRSFSLPLLDTSQEEEAPPSQINNPPYLPPESNILSQLLAEESNLQKRISEIYSLDKGLRYETNSISSLHQDKEMLECTLSGMRNKILDHQDRPSELQKLKKQQKMIEKELVRVKRLLSTSAKKIEDAANKNDQMERDILHLRQILTEALKTGSSEMKSQRNRADLEAELCRVQNVLDELANHRQEINNTVEKLKSESHPTVSSCTDIRASPTAFLDDKEDSRLRKARKGVEVRASPTGVAGSAPLPVRKKQHSTYLETDLDTMHIRDLANLHEKDFDDIPVYANAEEFNSASEEISKGGTSESENLYENCVLETSDQCSMQDINEADERMKRFYGIIPKEKPSEIKTVRIVKRQSERRNRERDKKRVTYDDQSSVWVVEEPDLSSDDHLDIEDVQPSIPSAIRPSSIQLLTSNNNRPPSAQSAHERLFGTAAKSVKPTSNNSQDRAYPVKRSKRRHYTVSGYQYMLDPQFSQYFKDRPRSRDDVDMERCLRTANTPDIVRSTIKKSDVFDDKMIERELMLPQKIEIPERYVEVEPEQLSAMEKLRRSQKAENICKMLSETSTSTYENVVEERSKSPEAIHKKLSEEKRNRAHLLNLNRAIAREVVEKSKAVAVLATLERMMKKPLTPVEEDISPMAPLPITQQRYNFFA